MAKNTKKGEKKWKVPPRFELGLPDSESGVLTITPWDLLQNALTLLYES